MAKAALGRRGDALRAAVFAATFEELAANGLDQTTIGKIALRAGVHETSIYRRWKTREALVIDALLDRSATAIPLPDTGSIREDLLLIVRGIVFYLRSPGGGALVRAGVIAAEPELVAAREAFWRGRLAALQPLLNRAVARGELKASIDPHLVLEMLIAPLHARLLVTGHALDDDLPERLVDLVLDGARTGR